MRLYNNLDEPIAELNVADNSYRYRAIMGDNSLTLHFSLAEHLEVPLGAYCEFEGARYYVTRPEHIKMKHSRHFDYTLVMEGEETRLKIWKFRNTIDGRLKFPLTAKPHEHLQLLIDNLNKRGGDEWTLDDCIKENEKLITYDHDYCWDALNKIAKAFETEWEIKGRTISLRKVEYNKSDPLALSYGQGKGFLSGVGRSNAGEVPPMEILYVQGGEQNIDKSKYGSKVLLLPKNGVIAYDGLKFEDEEGFNPSRKRTYKVSDDRLSIQRADKPLASYAEASLDCSDVYPKREGEVTRTIVVNAEKHLYDFTDERIPEDLDFDKCIIPNETPIITFQSGMLAGRSFEYKYFHKWLNTNGTSKLGRRFELKTIEEDGLTMPNENFQPRPGDKYAIFKIDLPQAYINSPINKQGAEWDMFRKAVRYMFDGEEQQYSFTGTLDGLWAKKDWLNIGGRIKLGGYIAFTDKRFQSEPILIRITGIKDYINDPHSPEIELNNQKKGTGFSTMLKDLQSREVLIEERHREALQFSKRRFKDSRETAQALIEAQSKNFANFGERINPLTVDTMKLLVGDERLQFCFTDKATRTQTLSHDFHFDKATKQLKTEEGVIKHFTLGIKTISSKRKEQELKYWYLPSFESAVLTEADKRYYLYAKCIKGNTTGRFILSEQAIALEEVNGFYHLLVGVLNSEHEGERSFAPLYGFTEVLPNRITTDKIVSADGRTYFDLVRGEIGGKIRFYGRGQGEKDFYLTDHIKQTTDINGGLVLSSLIGAKDGQNNVRSYISGQMDKPAFSAGIENFGKPNESRSVEIMHDGNARFGLMNIKQLGDHSEATFSERLGNGAMEHYLRIGGNQPTLKELENATGESLNGTYQGQNSSFTITSLNGLTTATNSTQDSSLMSFNLKNDGLVNIRIKGKIRSDLSPRLHYDFDEGVFTYLGKTYNHDHYAWNDLYYDIFDKPLLINLNVMLAGKLLQSKLISIVRNTTGSLEEIDTSVSIRMPKGRHDIRVFVTPHHFDPIPRTVISNSNEDQKVQLEIKDVSIELKTNLEVKEAVFGREGLSAVFGQEQMFYLQRNGYPFATLKGTTNMPGILASGYAIYRWKDKRVVRQFGYYSQTSAQHNGINIYEEGTSAGYCGLTFPQDLPDNYTVQLTPVSTYNQDDDYANSVKVMRMNKRSIQIRTFDRNGNHIRCDFMFTIIGANY